MTCATCEHCDTDEGRVTVRGGSPGICTLSGGFFQGKFVPTWLEGCPDYSPDWDRLSQSALDAIAARGPNVMRRLEEQR